MATDPAGEAAALEAIHKDDCFGDYNDPPEGQPLKHEVCYDVLRPIVAAVTPLIRAQAFTEAADAIEGQRKDGQGWSHPGDGGVQFESFRAGWVRAMERSAALVRGLGEETEPA